MSARFCGSVDPAALSGKATPPPLHAAGCTAAMLHTGGWIATTVAVVHVVLCLPNLSVTRRQMLVTVPMVVLSTYCGLASVLSANRPLPLRSHA